MKKIWTLAGLAIATQANAGLIDINAETYGWGSTIDVDGDGIHDFMSGITNGSARLTPDVYDPETDTFSRHIFDTTQFEFGIDSRFSNGWSRGFVNSGTVVDHNILVYSGLSTVIEHRDYTGTEYGKASEYCIEPEICWPKPEWEDSVAYEGDEPVTVIDESLYGRGLIGFGIRKNDGMRYGWVDIELSESEIRIHGGKVSDTVNEAVVAVSANVPTPATLGLLATGLAMGAVARRRRLAEKSRH